MIINIDKVIAHIKEWIFTYVKSNNKSTLVTYLSPDNHLSMVNTLLCAKTNLPVIYFSNSLVDKNILDSFKNVKKYSFNEEINNIENTIFNLPLNNSIKNQIILYHLASKNNGIIAGDLCKENYDLCLFSKNCAGDILPMADLHETEIVELFKYLYNSDEVPRSSLMREFNNDLIDWAIRENDLYKILYEEDPVKNKHWARYTVIQRQCIAKLSQVIKINSHKQVLAPVCTIREIKGLVRS